MSLFKSNHHCGNCFWFIQDTGKCEFFKWEPDLIDKCQFFESKANARKILEFHLKQI